MTKTRLIYLLLIASLLAFVFGCFHVLGASGLDGMSDGGGLL